MLSTDSGREAMVGRGAAAAFEARTYPHDGGPEAVDECAKRPEATPCPSTA